MLPGLEGLAAVKLLRGAGIQTPILILTTKAGIDDRVEGLEAGADDYLVKPFAFAELLARIHALGRRRPLALSDMVLREGEIEMDLVSRAVRRAGRQIELLPREYQLLEVLLRNAGRIVTRTMLLERVWNYQFDPRTSIVETHMSRLRGKIDRGYATEMIRTVRGSGYMLSAPY